MPVWAWILIAVAVAFVIAIALWQARSSRRTGALRERFGPEYDRTVDSADSRREAEADLRAREERRSELEIKPLTQAARDRYVEGWQVVQSQFVDDPRSAVASADGLIRSVLAERGYPPVDLDQRTADVSVDHPEVVQNYREGQRLSEGSTEELRQAMKHYRALFEELVEPDGADDPIARDRVREPDGSRVSA